MVSVFDSEKNLEVLKDFFEYVVLGVLDNIMINFTIEKSQTLREKVFPQLGDTRREDFQKPGFKEKS